MRRWLSGLLAVALTVGLLPTGMAEAATTTPKTVVLDGAQLVRIKQKLNGKPNAALKSVLAKADAYLTQGPWSVTSKNQTPPSGDKHDYMSQAPYWWASKPKTPDNPDGCPYVSKDGQRNPEADAISDHTTRAQAWEAIPLLALAWFYTGDAKYAKHAELAVRTWFLDAATKMNPNMRYSQRIPCRTEVRGTGIIDSTQSFSSVVDALAILDSGAPGWTSGDRSGMKTWLTSYLDWMTNSPQAKDELAATNNHGTWLDMQNATIALYLGKTAQAKAIVESVKTNRIAKQIKADGSQPLELSRTMSWHYSNFNLAALGRLAEIGDHVGVNLWKYTAPNGASLVKAVDFLIPAAEKGAPAWPYQQINTFDRWIAIDILHAAAEEANDAKAAAVLPKVPAPPVGDQWPVRPAVISLNLPSK
ncbi:Alginate lyase [Amycolatopsis xylanica]|uniref:Alginate lyase n=1 Tax=Amycolatopsis xylanica TaxID=589385 RepID=A0A1H3NIY5_9PSEU|nr:alginate lyase family protein [Amycolatopsis xylanica]SDY88650.1 Alginate lyase [Amycolatopsis xylanica]